MRRGLEILAPGPLTTVQDLGRPGHLAVGVGRSGAADRGSYLLANRLLGNTDRAAALEVTLGGLHLRAHGDLLVCLTGATTPADVDGRPAVRAAPFEVRHGQRLVMGMPVSGLRTYVAVRGGLAVPTVLGSASFDTMSGLGPPPLRAGQVVPVGTHTERFPEVDVAPVADPPSGTVELDVLPGPRLDWFADPGQLAGIRWFASAHSDRKGVRLDGPPLKRRPERGDTELASEGMVRGAVQVTRGGRPVIFLNDHPVTGGYPVIAVLTGAAVDRAAQLVPGQAVRFRWQR